MANKKENILKEFIEIPGVNMTKAKALFKAGYESLDK